MKRIFRRSKVGGGRSKYEDAHHGTGDLTGQEAPNHHLDDDEVVEHYDMDDDTLYTDTGGAGHDNNSTAANNNKTATTTADEETAAAAAAASAYHEVESYYSINNTNGHRVTSTAVRTPPDRAAQTRNLVKKFIADIWNRGELDLIPEVCSPSLRFNGNTGFDRVGHDGLARMVATIRDALDEYHCEIHSMVVEDNKAFCRLRFTGKHTGPLLGFPPTQQTVAWMGATEFTCQNDKILKVWELGDVKSLEEQLTKAKQEAGADNICGSGANLGVDDICL